MQYYEEGVRAQIVKGMVLLLAAAILIVGIAVIVGGETITASIAFENIDGYAIVTSAHDFVNMSRVNNVLNVTVNRDGDYPFLLRSDDGREYPFQLSYHKGDISADADSSLTYSISVH